VPKFTLIMLVSMCKSPIFIVYVDVCCCNGTSLLQKLRKLLPLELTHLKMNSQIIVRLGS
jgi:hypothetical protein